MKFENTRVYGIDTAIRSMRMPLQSFDKADSEWVYDEVIPPITTDEYQKSFQIGEKDLDLAHRLLSTGTDSDSKFLRSISVYTELTAPTYFTNELHTYKIGTVSNSSSLQHKGASRDFTIEDFSFDDKRIYEILRERPSMSEKYPVIYPYNTEEYKEYVSQSGVVYKVYRNGKIFSCNHKGTDGRCCHEKQITPTINAYGYYYVTLGNSEKREKWLVHRLVATLWIKNINNKPEINHKNFQHGDNSVENLEWVTNQENNMHSQKNSVKNIDLRTKYLHFKQKSIMSFSTKMDIKQEYQNGNNYRDLANKYGVSIGSIRNVLQPEKYYKPEHELFELCLLIENMIEIINQYRRLYVETKDYNYFRLMRQFMMMSFNYTISWTANYQVLRTIYFQRRNHRLKEWTDVFIPWIESLPYAKDLITYEGGNK